MLEAVQGDQFVPQNAFQQEFFFEPHRHGREKRFNPSRRESNVGFQEALELDQRLVIEHEILEVPKRNPAFLQAVADRVGWEPGIELFPREALLLSGRHDLTIANQACSAVVIVG